MTRPPNFAVSAEAPMTATLRGLMTARKVSAIEGMLKDTGRDTRSGWLVARFRMAKWSLQQHSIAAPEGCLVVRKPGPLGRRESGGGVAISLAKSVTCLTLVT